MENWIQAFYDAVDSSNYEVSMSYYADDIRAQLGNKPATVGKDALIQGLSIITDVAKGTKHQFLAEAETEDAEGKITMLESNVAYSRWNNEVVIIPCVTVLRHKNEKIQDICLYLDLAPLLQGPSAKFHSTGAVQVNPPGREPKLTRSDIWRALVAKSEDASRFVPTITSCVVLEREGNAIVREAVINGVAIRERVTYEPEKRVIFTRIDAQEMGTIYNDIVEDENGELWLHFTFDLERADLADGSPLAQQIAQQMSDGYAETFQSLIQEAAKIAAAVR